MSTPMTVDGVRLEIDEDTTAADVKAEMDADMDTILAYRDGDAV